MSGAVASAERLLAFELGGMLYALPIADVAEVAEAAGFAAVPMLPRRIGGVVNHHGDPLPVVFGAALFDSVTEAEQPPRHLLVLARDPDDASRYGLPVDRIWGLIDGPAAVAHGPGFVAERRPVEGRLLSILDPRRLLQRVTEVVEQSMNGVDITHGGES